MTDQTSAHDPANGYLPEHWSLEKWKDLRKREPEEVAMSARESIANHVQAILQFKAMGIPCVDYGNNIRQEAKNAGVNAFDYPASCRRTSRPMFASGRAVPLVALSGDAEDIARTDAKVKELFRKIAGCSAGSTRFEKSFQGLPARICWLGLGQRHLAGLAFNEMVRTGEAQGADRHRPRSPRRRLGGGPNRETEAMHDGTDAVSDWPLLNLMLNTASGRPGCRSTTAAASAWATRSTPAW